MSDRGFITPPPGLLPDAPAPRQPDETTGGTAPSVDMPAFFPSPPSAPPPADEPVLDTSSAAPAGEPQGPSSPRGPVRLVLTRGQVRFPVVRDVYLGRAPVLPEGSEADVLAIAGEGTVSKTHAVLRPDGEGATLEDLGSTNGTAEVLDGEPRLLAPRTPLRLHAPAVIRLGDAVLELALLPD